MYGLVAHSLEERDGEIALATLLQNLTRGPEQAVVVGGACDKTGFGAQCVARLMKTGLRRTVMAAFAVMLALCAVHAARAQKPSENPHHGFHDAAYWAKTFESPERAKWQKPDQVVRALKLKPGQVVIDIGAGTGYFTRRFAKAVAPLGKAVGLDIEPEMVAYMQADAKKLGVNNYDARVVKPDDPGLAPNSVDLVFFCDTLHHMDNRVAYFRKLAAALRPGGRVAVIDFKKKPLPLGPPPEIKLSREQVVGEFHDAGYRLVAEYNFLPYQYFLEFEPG
jgi:arsenite methyltransferase